MDFNIFMNLYFILFQIHGEYIHAQNAARR